MTTVIAGLEIACAVVGLVVVPVAAVRQRRNATVPNQEPADVPHGEGEER